LKRSGPRMWAAVTAAAMLGTAQQIHGQLPDSMRARVVMLGTGTPNADPERSGPAVAIVVNGSVYLVDAGPGIVRRAAAAHAAGISALTMPNLSRVFLTHLHSDHTVGLPDLMLSPWVLERKKPLQVYGPPGTAHMVQHLSAAYAEDIHIRLYGLEPSNKSGYRAIAHEIAPGVVYQDSNVTVRAFAVEHGSWKHAFGYRFETRDRVIVVSGDTRATQKIVQACNGCDVLVHEAYSDSGFKRRPLEWQRYHAAFHTPASDVGRIATAARAKLLVLYHQLYWGSTDDDIVREVEATYSGKVISARDLGVY
jgi:ribonuclease BN (tRNA processing enzyme)